MLIVLNNKCNLLKDEFFGYQDRLNNIKTKNTLVLCPVSIFLGFVNLSSVKLGAQNVASTDCGAYTGEISAKQLSSFNVEYCIVGHSERRLNQNENNEIIFRKIKKLLEENIVPILCVGENKKERDNNQQLQVIRRELENIGENLSQDQREKIIIAYEPIWAIGTNVLPSNEQISEIITFIKKLFPQNKVLYGGSVNDDNITTLKNIDGLDGYLIGGLSLNLQKLQIFLSEIEN